MITATRQIKLCFDNRRRSSICHGNWSKLTQCDRVMNILHTMLVAKNEFDLEHDNRTVKKGEYIPSSHATQNNHGHNNINFKSVSACLRNPDNKDSKPFIDSSSNTRCGDSPSGHTMGSMSIKTIISDKYRLTGKGNHHSTCQHESITDGAI